ncbi:MAG: nucleoside recognition domain-containing protein [Tannerellaceae bacterium]|jgi:spore maturation protein SpmB|nr:nucleoside recognition domain-containing protein [Tannerellaceae bacterium]
MKTGDAPQRILGCIRRALPKSAATCLWLLKIILPVSLGVELLRYFGLLAYVAEWFGPLFALIGLPGETAIVFITSVFCPLYAPIALISTMSLGGREATILALMCLVSHSLIIESSVQAKTGSGFWEMTVLRLVMSFVIALTLNFVMPHEGWSVVGSAAGLAGADESFGGVLLDWLGGSLRIVGTILVIVTLLMILHYVLDEFRLMTGISALFAPLMKVMGLPRETAFLWFVGNIVGLAYGGAIMVEQVREGKLTPAAGNLLNYHLAVNHSMLEDTLIFVAIGIPALWILLTRLAFAAAVVWLRRLYGQLSARYI